jgi:hypothetical protein
MNDKQYFLLVVPKRDERRVARLIEGVLCVAPIGSAVAPLTEDPREHRCALPASIVEALNSGDGTYRP